MLQQNVHNTPSSTDSGKPTRSEMQKNTVVESFQAMITSLLRSWG